MAEFSPWESYPGLALERLTRVAEVIKTARHTAVLSHNHTLGDDGWTLGCVAYRRSCFAIESLKPECEWLTILEEDQNRFTFAIASVPLKFYQGNASDPPSRSLAVSYAELVSIQQSLEFGVIPDNEHLLRLAVETDQHGEATRVILVELYNGSVSNTFVIPMEGGSSVLAMKPKPIDPGPPTFTPRQGEDEKERGANRERNAG